MAWKQSGVAERGKVFLTGFSGAAGFSGKRGGELDGGLERLKRCPYASSHPSRLRVFA